MLHNYRTSRVLEYVETIIVILDIDVVAVLSPAGGTPRPWQ